MARDILRSEPDLSVFEGACLGEGVTFQCEPVDLLDSTFDADLFTEAGLSPAEEIFALQLPLGALAHESFSSSASATKRLSLSFSARSSLSSLASSTLMPSQRCRHL